MALVDLEAPTQPGQRALADVDLHLARLSQSLPYEESFVPLVDALPVSGSLQDLCKGLDFLLAGFGETGHGGVFQVGWAPRQAPMGGVGPAYIGASSDPRAAGAAVATNGDSGGGIFVFGPSDPTGALAGLMQRGNVGYASSNGFPVGVRSQIDAVLADPALNPWGDRVQWRTASEVDRGLVRPLPPLMIDAGGVDDVPAVPQYGLVTTNLSGNLQIRIPRAKSCTDGKTPVFSDGGYRVRLIREGAPLDSDPLVYDVSPDTPNFMIPRDIDAGDWFLTVTARQYSDVLQDVVESLSASRVRVRVPAVRPVALDHVDVSFERVDLADGNLHWNATFKGVLADTGPVPEGILWVRTAPNVFSRSIDMGDTDPLVISDKSRRPNPYQPGDVLTVYAYPYIGAAIGPVTSIHVTVPASLP